MSTSRNVYTGSRDTSALDLLQSLFGVELLNPSKEVWICSPWITDTEIMDNTAGSFSTLMPNWPRTRIRLSKILQGFMEKGSRVFIVHNRDKNNNSFLDRINALSAFTPNKLKLIPAQDDETTVHEKGILTDNFAIAGSMNITRSGITFNQEYVQYTTKQNDIGERAIHYHTRYAAQWGGSSK